MARALTTNVIIGGSTTAGFDALSGKILALGQIFNQVGGQVGQWEQESVETYKNYETYMLEAKGAMSANYKSASQLESVYNSLQQKAQQWAGSTIFHTNDVAKAISEAAHAGWDYDQMLQGIPTSILLAQAGNTDLSTGLDMLIKTINGTGIAFEDAGTFVDQWVMAANSSATTVSELGEAMEKMGATARFGDSTGELLTMLSVLANTGTVGAAAGTLLRNSMIRLIAPTKNAREAMEGLGVTADEINEAVGSDSSALTEVNDLLTQAGFSAYDSKGKLKPFLETFKDLDKALRRLPDDQQRNKVLSAIFPTRTITGAKSLLEAATNDYNGLLEKILSSEGYAARVAQTQVSGLMGSEELFKSKWEEFSRKIGEILSGPLENLYDIGGKIVDKFNSADPETLSAIAGAATAISVAGPGLITAALGMKAFSMLGLGGAGFLAGVIGVGALAGYLTKISEMALENNFGQMAIDMNAIGESLKLTESDFAVKTEAFATFRNAAKQAVQDYKNSGQELVESLWSKMVTGEELTPDQEIALNQQAETFIKNLKAALETKAAENLSIANIIYGQPNEEGQYTANPDDPMYAALVAMIDEGYNQAISEAQKKSAELRAAMTEAFKDKTLTPEELKNIQELMNQINSLIEGVNPNDINLRKMLLQSQRVGLGSIQGFSEEVNASKQAALGDLDNQALELIATMQALYDKAVKDGTGFFDPYSGEWVDDASKVDIQKWTDDLMRDWTAKETEMGFAWDDVLMKAWQNTLETNIETGKLFQDAEGIVGKLTSGDIDFETARRQMSYLQGDFTLMGRSIKEMMEFYGGTDGMAELVTNYRNAAEKAKEKGKIADASQYNQTADWLESVLRIYDLVTNSIDNAQGMVDAGTEEAKGRQSMMDALRKLYRGEEGEDYVKAVYEALSESARNAWDQQIAAANGEFDLFGMARGTFFDWTGVDKQISEWIAQYLMTNGLVEPEEYRRPPATEQTTEQPQEQAGGLPLVDIEPYMAGQDPLASLQDQLVAQGAVQIPVEGETDGLQAAIQAEDLKTLTEYVKGDAGDLHISIMDEDGQLLTENVTGDASQLESVINKYQHRTITLFLHGMPLFAEGGRASEPSIFGEDGAEWAIPEEHSTRTANLLNAAREASGFTWGELLEKSGGFKADGGEVNVNISSYAPVINANDAAGVADELRKDKLRLGDIIKKAVREALDNMNLMSSIEVYT